MSHNNLVKLLILYSGFTMSPNVNFYDYVHPKNLLHNLAELQRTGMFCDVTLVANEQKISAHKVILAAASPYFSAMFSTGMKETNEDKVSMDVDYIGLRDIVNFIYTSKIEICEQNVYSVMELCDMLQVPTLRPVCSHYLMSTLKPSNCMSVYVRAKLGGYHALAHVAYRFVLQNFSSLMEEEEFLYTPADTLAPILESRLLNVTGESQILQCIFRWLKHDPARSLNLENLMTKVDLQKVPVEDLLAAEVEPQVLANAKLSELISGTILTLNQNVENTEAACNVQEKVIAETRYASEQAVLLAFGGELENLAFHTVECFTLGYDGWRCVVPWAVPTGGFEEETRVLPTMHHSRYHFAVAARDYEVFVIGGCGHYHSKSLVMNSVEYYSIKTNVWTEVQVLPFAVAGARAAFINGNLMVVGGTRDDKTISKDAWVYEERHNAWHQVASMSYYRADHGVATVADCLYAVGGVGGKNSHHCHEQSCMERYSPQLDCWHTLSPMVERRAQFGCAAFNQFIYVLGGIACNKWIKTVERYNTLTDNWTYVCSMSYPRINFATTVSNKCIYILGGDDSIQYRQAVEKYSVLTNRWHCVHSMRFMRCKAGAATLFVPCFSNS